jgi:hypothetical protein
MSSWTTEHLKAMYGCLMQSTASAAAAVVSDIPTGSQNETSVRCGRRNLMVNEDYTRCWNFLSFATFDECSHMIEIDVCFINHV